MQDVSIRLARISDAAKILEITRDSFAAQGRRYYTAGQIAGWMDGVTPDTYIEAIEAGRIHLAESGGAVIGYVDAVPGEILRLFVLPDAAGKGVGTLLAKRGMARACPTGSGRITVEALLNAVSFYERLGFVKAGRGFSSHGTPETPPIEIVRMVAHAKPVDDKGS